MSPLPPPVPLLSPYGTLSGSLFQYSSSPSLVAFESIAPSSHEIAPPKNKCILLGGLSDGLLPTPYTELLSRKLQNLNIHDNPTEQSSSWSLIQPILSSSYLGFGNGMLSRDTNELGSLMRYLTAHRSAEKFAIIGHSTGCQMSLHFVTNGDEDMVERTKFVALQAPVSDREGPNLESTYESNIKVARDLVREEKGDEFMPRSAFWAPITANRFLSLQDKHGEDDFFSSDYSEEELSQKLGPIGRRGKETGLKVLVAYSGKDEYVPDHVDKRDLLDRLCNAMNGVEEHDVAVPMFLEDGNHNLSKGEGDKERFVDRIGNFLELL